MKKIIIIPIISASLLVAACRGNNTPTSSGTSSFPTTSSVIPTSATSSPTTAQSSSATSSHSSSSTKTSSSTSSSTSTSPKPVSYISIKEANKKSDGKVITTRGRTIQSIDIKTSMEILVYICDGEDMIPVLTNGQSEFYKKVSNYIGKETSNYYITGTINHRFDMTILEVSDYQLQQSMTFDIDYSKFQYSEYSKIDTYNSYVESINYNKKGHGVGKLSKLTSLKCIAKADDNSWLFTDGNYVQGCYHQLSNTAFTVGNVYDVYGISCVYAWKPSLRVLDYKLSSEKITLNIDAVSIPTTATEMYSVGAPSEDIEKCENTNKFLRTFKYFYKASIYFNYYQTSSGLIYIVAGDKFYSSPITTVETACANKMFKFNNPTYNKISSVGDIARLPVKDYVGQEILLDTYFVEYQFTTVNKKEMPQIYMLEDYIPKISFPENDLHEFFSGQTYLISEGQIPIYTPINEEIFFTVDKKTNFEVVVTGVTNEAFLLHIEECNSNSYITLKTHVSTDNYKFYKQKQTSCKFTYELTYDESQEVLDILIKKPN